MFSVVSLHTEEHDITELVVKKCRSKVIVQHASGKPHQLDNLVLSQYHNQYFKVPHFKLFELFKLYKFEVW